MEKINIVSLELGYLVSKLLPLFVYPLGLSLLLIGVGWIALRKQWIGGGQLALGGAVVLLWVSAMPSFSHWIMGSLEKDYPPVAASALPVADAVVVLGGMVPGVVPGTRTPQLSAAADRLLHAMRLYRAGRAPLVIVSGGAASGYSPEAELMAQVLEELGVPASALLKESRSRNTYQNALYTQELLEKKEIRKVLLVTSAYHMKRARAVFESMGVQVIPAPTDYQIVEGPMSVLDFLPDAEALYWSTVGIKEYLGWWVYRLRGWIR